MVPSISAMSMRVIRAGRCRVMREAINMLGIDPNVMVIHIDTLERRRFVRRKKNPRDRREQLIMLTEKGRRLLRAAFHARTKANRVIFAGMSAKDLRQMVDAANVLLAHAKKIKD